MQEREALARHAPYGTPTNPNNTRCERSGGECEVAVMPGKPQPGQGCGNGAIEVGHNVGDPNGQPRTIVDENEIYVADGRPYNQGGVLYVHSHVWGWVYKDNVGDFWIQINKGYTWTPSFAVTINNWTFGLNAPTGAAPVDVGPKDRCHRKGNRTHAAFSRGINGDNYYTGRAARGWTRRRRFVSKNY